MNIEEKLAKAGIKLKQKAGSLVSGVFGFEDGRTHMFILNTTNHEVGGFTENDCLFPLGPSKDPKKVVEACTIFGCSKRGGIVIINDTINMKIELPSVLSPTDLHHAIASGCALADEIEKALFGVDKH